MAGIKRYNHALKHINCLLITPLITVTPLSAFPVAHLQLAGTVTLLCGSWAHSAASLQTLLDPEGWKTNPKNPHILPSIPVASRQTLTQCRQAGNMPPQWQRAGQEHADDRGLVGQRQSEVLEVWDSGYNLQSVGLRSPSRALLQLPTGNCKFPLNHRKL